MNERVRFALILVPVLLRNMAEEALVWMGVGRIIERGLRKRLAQEPTRLAALQIGWAFSNLERIVLRRGDVAEFKSLVDRHVDRFRADGRAAEVYLSAAHVALDNRDVPLAAKLVDAAKAGGAVGPSSRSEVATSYRILKKRLDEEAPAVANSET